MIKTGIMDLVKIRAYENINSPAVLVQDMGGGRWKIETPEENLYFENFADLMADINANLDAVRELVECGQIERELWEEAWRS